ncbi:MAG TPA: SRPBCC family protein [Bacteroidia bacterium]|nr:SRPBCC family protein [Bacteroidia bacterium]HNU34302.1 SRPBCC family protein [Bacteroidia bacterium]
MLKKILKFLGILILVLLIGSLFISKEYKTEKSIVINAPASVVYDQVNNLKNWQSWEPWRKEDPSMKISYEGPESGANAKYSWISEKMGNGTMTITESTANKNVKTALNFGPGGDAYGGFNFEEVAEGTKVTWDFNFPVGWNPIGKYMTLMMDGEMQKKMTEGLDDLKKSAEAAPKPEAAANIKIEEKDIAATPYLFVKATSTVETISNVIGESYGKVGEAMGKQKLTQAGAPFCIYYKWENNNFEFDAGIPSSGAGKDDGEVKAGELKAGKAVVATYFGPYEGTAKAHEAVDAYMKEKGLTPIGNAWEVYANDPMVVKDPAKFQTDVYYRIQ